MTRSGVLVSAGLLLLSAMFLLSSPAQAFWPANGRFVTASDDSSIPVPASDDQDGAIIAFTARRVVGVGDTVRSAYLHHVLSTGEVDPTWPAAGKLLTSSTAGQLYPIVIQDGTGSFYVGWRDSVSGFPRLMVLRVTSAGTPASGWPANGLTATAGRIDSLDSREAGGIPDGAGGVFVVWNQRDGAGSGNLNIHARHLTSTGSVAGGWPDSGKVIVDAIGDQKHFAGVPDGSGGIILAWTDYRNTALGQIFALRIDSAGNVVSGWTANGSPVVSNATDEVSFPNVIEDGSNGAIIAWKAADVIYGMHLNGAGAPQWAPTTTGVLVDSTAAQGASLNRTVSDGSGGAIVVWSDFVFNLQTVSFSSDIFAQHLGSGGNRTWATGGVPLLSASPSSDIVTGVVPSLGGAVVAWWHYDLSGGGGASIKAQRVNSAGSVPWSSEGITVAGDSTLIPLAITDGSGGAIITWFDKRAVPDSGVYAARISVNGVTGPSAVTVSSIVVSPVSGGVELSWSAFSSGQATFQVYRATNRDGPYAAVSAEMAASPSQHDFHFQDLGTASGGTYFYELAWREGAQGAWQRSSPVRVVAGAAVLSLHRVQPNPARGPVVIEYEVAHAGAARLEVFDLGGRRVRTLFSAPLAAGQGSIRWDGRDADGVPLPSGAYFMRLTSGAQHAEQRLVWLR